MNRRPTLNAWVVAVLVVGSSAWGQGFSYDPLGRLIEVRYDGTHTIQYDNDRLGNITNLVVPASQGETDTDVDSMADAWELVHFNDLTNEATGDYNRDAVNNLAHYLNGTDPVDVDHDDDGSDNWMELLAGTDITNPASCLQLEQINMDGGVIIRWQSVGGKSYRLQRYADPIQGSVSNVATGIAATPSFNVYTTTPPAGPGSHIYLIELE